MKVVVALLSCWSVELSVGFGIAQRGAGSISQSVGLSATSDKHAHIEDDGFSVKSLTQHPKKNFLMGAAFRRQVKKPGSLILVRHGESLWNSNSTFSGWADPDLSRTGEREIEHAARLLLAAGYSVDVAYTSRLKRAIRSTWILLRELDQIYRPVYKSWRLNERCYGALTGLSKPGLALELGEEKVQSWRHGLFDVPPPLTPDHAYYPGKDRKYADLPVESIPLSESLQHTMERTLPLWRTRIVGDLLAGKNVLVVAHGNSLRGVVKHIDSISDEDIVNVSIPNGIPLVYEFDRVRRSSKNGVENDALRPVTASVSGDAYVDSENPLLTGHFLEKKGLLRAALDRETELQNKIPGFEDPSGRRGPLSPALRALAKLELERKLMELAGDSLSSLESKWKEGTAGGGKPSSLSTADASYMMGFSDDQTEVREKRAAAEVADETVGSWYKQRPNQNVAPVNRQQEQPQQQQQQQTASTDPVSEVHDDGPIIIIVRHGKTTHNQLGLFTGWEDVSLAKQGQDEAHAAGALLRRHGIELDIVYTSWLSRAIETAWIMLSELDSLWIPIYKSWRLNERMYGALTGLSKKMIALRHGEAKFKKWRRGYAQRPPQVSSFSHHYPGNDERYVKYVEDVQVSFRESLVRTLADGKLTISRKFPKAESLKDCNDRTIPFYTNVIESSVLDHNRNVLIASSENAIRGLLMHLCQIPADRISEIEIPTGLPLIFSSRQKCLRVLDDGLYGEFGDSPQARYNFGKAADLLFKPCDPKFSEYCKLGPDGAPSPDPIIRLKSRDSAKDAASATEKQYNHQPSSLVEQREEEEKERELGNNDKFAFSNL